MTELPTAGSAAICCSTPGIYFSHSCFRALASFYYSQTFCSSDYLTGAKTLSDYSRALNRAYVRFCPNWLY